MAKKKLNLEEILVDLDVDLTKVREIFPELYPKFSEMLVEAHPERAYLALKDAKDREGLSAVGRKLVETNPRTAYWAFRYAEDREGLNAARERLVETDPETAYQAFKDAEDREGLSAARERLVETDPRTAYWAFKDAEDREGLNILIEYIHRKTGADKTKLEKLLYF